MKKVLLTIAIVSAVSLANAADWTNSEGSCYQKGNMNGSFGLSLAHFGFYGTFDYAFHDALSAGGGLGYNGYSRSHLWRFNYFPIVGRVLLHIFNLDVFTDRVSVRDKLDLYAGLSVGWSAGWASWRGSGVKLAEPDDVGRFIFRENIGARYYFAPAMYAFIEEGAGFGWINAGAGRNF